MPWTSFHGVVVLPPPQKKKKHQKKLPAVFFAASCWSSAFICPSRLNIGATISSCQVISAISLPPCSRPLDASMANACLQLHGGLNHRTARTPLPYKCIGNQKETQKTHFLWNPFFLYPCMVHTFERWNLDNQSIRSLSIHAQGDEPTESQPFATLQLYHQVKDCRI